MPEPITQPVEEKPASELTREEAAARAGVDPSRIVAGPTGEFVVAPSETLPGGTFQAGGKEVTVPKTATDLEGPTSPVGGTERIQKEVDEIGKNIQAGLVEFGIEKPDQDTVDSVSADIIKDIETRRRQLEQRQKEDITRIKEEGKAGEEELKIQQEEAMAQATGRARIGGFLVYSEVQDLQKMERQHRLEKIAYKGQMQATLRESQRAYEDTDYALAQDKYKEYKDKQKESEDREQTYFDNVVKYNQMSTPMSRANKAMQDQVINWATKYPDAFADLEPSDLLDLTVNQAYRKVLDSKSYKDEISGATDVLSIAEAKALKVPYGTTRKQAIAKGIIPSGTDEGDFTSTQINQGAANAGVSIAAFKNYDADTKNFFLNKYKDAKEIIDDNIDNLSDSGMDDREASNSLHEDVNAQPVSQQVKDYLNNYIDKQLPLEPEEEPEEGQFRWYNPLSWF